MVVCLEVLVALVVLAVVGALVVGPVVVEASEVVPVVGVAEALAVRVASNQNDS